MIPIRGLFETHVTVSDLNRAMKFYGETLGLKLAHMAPGRGVAFYWLGRAGESMLGVWEAGSAPMRMSLHLAFRVELEDILQAPARLRAAGITPLDFASEPTGEPVVLAWIPAASLYFQDPDGNLLEYLCMLDEPPQPHAGVVPWSRWRAG